MSGFSWVELERKFVHRRAWRYGELRKKDVMEAFSLSEKTATKRISEALTDFNPQGEPYIIKNKWAVLPNTKVEPPFCAGEEDFISLNGTYNDKTLFFSLTGLRQDEIFLSVSEWVNPLSPTKNALLDFIKALSHPETPTIFESHYTSLSHNDIGRQMMFVPLSMLIIGGQVSLYVFCLEQKKGVEAWERVFAPRNLVLSRIKKHQIVKSQKIKSSELRFVMPSAREKMLSRNIFLNENLTKEQISVVRHELMLGDSNTITKPASQLFQFLRMFSNLPANGVWPPITEVKDI